MFKLALMGSFVHTDHFYTGIDEEYCVALAMFTMALIGIIVRTDHVYPDIDGQFFAH